jgi:hypothetical protein
MSRILCTTTDTAPQNSISSYLFAIGTDPEVDITKGASTHSFGDTIFLNRDEKSETTRWVSDMISMVIARKTLREFVPRWRSASQKERSPFFELTL